VDDWRGVEVDECRDQVYAQFARNLADLIANSKVRVLTCRHSEVTLREPIYDMVFIDGDHEYDSVVRDITVWKAMLQQGGLMCGHDSQHTPVMDAVKYCCSQHKFAPGDIWYAA
jgi:predicted O-methyltransferase YrrM